MQNILIYCPDPETRAIIARYFVEIGHFQQLHAETQKLALSLVLNDDIHLAILFDPAHNHSLVRLKDFIRQKRQRTRVRILPARRGQLAEGWREVIDDALKPVRPRHRSALGTHPRFTWKPDREAQ